MIADAYLYRTICPTYTDSPSTHIIRRVFCLQVARTVPNAFQQRAMSTKSKSKLTSSPILSNHPSSLHALTPAKAALLRTHLTQWYLTSARPLPWRLPPIPYNSAPYPSYIHRMYCCLLSETMLQQTQVKTVLPYYKKWLQKFPTIQALAAANEEEVMAAWAGLGYYSRAKRLHQAAKHLLENFVEKEKEVPTSTEYWVKNVPGVGPYTAGAIVSIAFDVPAPLVDGNVQRVLSRLLAIHGDVSTPKSAGSTLVWETAGQLVAGEKHPGDLNQSLMELGATICTPVAPNCSKCPVRSECLAYGNLLRLKRKRKSVFGKVEICPGSIDVNQLPVEKPDLYIPSFYPFKPIKKAQREEIALVLVIVRGREENAVYLEKKAKGLLAGLYDFPTVLLDGSSGKADLETALNAHKETLNARTAGTTKHLFSHIRRTSHVLISDADDALDFIASLRKQNTSGKWVEKAHLEDVGVSELCLKNWRLAVGEEKESKTKPSKRK
ncbi:DNA glycosylase, partial [Aulographum hederae CBS 113979]